MFTKVVSVNDDTLKEYEHWVYVVLSGQSPVTAGVQDTDKLQYLEDTYLDFEIRLIKGFASLRKALEFQQDTLAGIPEYLVKPLGEDSDPKFKRPVSDTPLVRGPVGVHNLYGLYDNEDKLLYIGVTDNPSRRECQHRKDKDFLYLKTIGTFDSREDALAHECAAINKYLPPLNVLVTPSSGTLEPLDFGEVSSKAAPKKKFAQYKKKQEFDLGPITVGVVEKKPWNTFK